MATEKTMAIGLIKRRIINPACLAFSHPFLLTTASFVVLIYRYRPSIFGFLVSSSPVIGCALVFLWILLNFAKSGDGRDGGGGNVNRSLQHRHRRKAMGSSSRVGCSSRRMKMQRFAAFDETSSSSDSGDHTTVINSILHTETTDCLLSDMESETLSWQNEEGEEEVREEKLEAESVVKWTADDEKNVRDVRTSELERNRKLEHLMSKRRSMNRQRRSEDNGSDDGRTEKSLIDFDADTSKQFADEELNRILPVALNVPRKNPFDSDGGEDEEEEAAESNAPGSAPSVLIPRRNPFDVEEAADDYQGFAVEAAGFLRRNETFTLGVSFSDHNRYERHISRFRPYFVPEKDGSDEMSYSVFHRQMSEITTETESVVSSVSDSSCGSSHLDPSIYSGDDEIHHFISRSTITSHTDDEEAREDQAMENSTSSVFIDSDTNVHHQSVMPIYDSSPTELTTESEELAAAYFYSGGVISPSAAALNPRQSLPRNASKLDSSEVDRGLLVPPSPPSKFSDLERPIEILPTIIEDDMDESRHDDDVDDDVVSETTTIPSKNVTITYI